MKPKERVLNALNHQTTDRIPISLVHGYWMQEISQELLKHYYLKGHETLQTIFNIDAYWVEPFYRGPRFGEDQQGNRFGIWNTPEYTYTYSEEMSRPLSEATSVADIENFPWPKIEWFDFSPITHFAKLYQDYAIVSPRRWSPTFSRIAELVGFETAQIWLLTDPKLIDAMVENITHWNCLMWENIIKAAPGQIDILYVGDDPAGQQGMMFSPELWRKHFKPAFKRLFQVAKQHNVKTMFHICGNPVSIIPDLIDVGMEILCPVQVSANEMSPIKLKKEFGADISFWGGVDVQHLLPNATPEEVRKNVRELIDILGKDGGYVLSSSHNLDIDIPVENITAMYEEAAVYYPH